MPINSQLEEKPIFPKIELEEKPSPRNLKDRFTDACYKGVPLFSINLAWFVLSLPIVTIFPALGGLYYAVMEMNEGTTADWGAVWEGFKNYCWWSLRWGILVFLVNVVLAVNIRFYASLAQNWAVFAMTASIVLLFVWNLINQFSFPLLLLQKDKKISVAIRNGYVVAMRQPLAALKVMTLTLLILVVSTLVPPLWIFISMALILQLQTRTVLTAVQRIREKDARRDAEKAQREAADDPDSLDEEGEEQV